MNTYGYDHDLRVTVASARNYARTLYMRTHDTTVRDAYMHFQRMLRAWYPGAAGNARRALAKWTCYLASTTPRPGGFGLDPNNARIAASNPGMRVLRRCEVGGTVTVRCEQFAPDGTLANATEASLAGIGLPVARTLPDVRRAGTQPAAA